MDKKTKSSNSGTNINGIARNCLTAAGPKGNFAPDPHRGLQPVTLPLSFRTSASKSKPKLTDAEGFKSFVDMAREVGASDDPKDFDEAFKRVALRKRQGERHEQSG
jgi:hypothetical protein